MNFPTRYLAAFLSIAFIGLLLYFFSDIVAYVAMAWVLSLVGQPFMRLFKKIRLGNFFQAGDTTCAILTLISFIFILGGLVSVFVPAVIQQARNLAEVDYASLVEGLEEPINDWTDWAIDKGFIEGSSPQDTVSTSPSAPSIEQDTSVTIPEKPHLIQHTTIEIDSLLLASGDTISKTNIHLNILLEHDSDPIRVQVGDPTAVVTETDTPLERIQKEVFSFFNPSQIQNLFSSVISFFGDFMIGVMSVLFITFFFLKEQQLFVQFLMAIVPTRYEQQIDATLSGIGTMLTRYFGGIAIQVTIITLYVSVALGLLGIENALLIGFFAAIINVIPYVGPIIGAAFGVFIVISSNLGIPFYEEMLPMILTVLGVFASMQLLDNFLLQPFIFSNSIKAHPLEIFIIILIGGKLGGILGMVLAIPVYTVLRVIARIFLSEFKIVKKITGGMDGM